MEARYDQVADSYRREGDDYTAPPMVALLDLVGPVGGMSVLDLACGEGVVARELARRGARVVGLDVCEPLLDRARASEAVTSLGIEYRRGDAAAAGVLAGHRFERIVCHFGLSDIDDLGGACATVTRLLQPQGRFVFSILHPCFGGGPGVSAAWPSDATYYDERWWYPDAELSTLRRRVGANHRMLSTYVNALTDRGLRLERLVEPAPETDWTIERPAAAAQPVYLVAAFDRASDRMSGSDASR